MPRIFFLFVVNNDNFFLMILLLISLSAIDGSPVVYQKQVKQGFVDKTAKTTGYALSE